jgi:hypothetical protein
MLSVPIVTMWKTPAKLIMLLLVVVVVVMT